MPWYSFSTDLHDWTHSHGLQPVILAYWIGLARKYDLYPHIAFNHAVISAEWDSAAQVYRIITRNTITGEEKTVTANILISAVGILDVPRYANIRGVREFKGEMFHSARWNETVKLAGKRVAVIGNGASA
jgi:cation diffusion facilitator CzcD-associated flavoprotein CzcO